MASSSTSFRNDCVWQQMLAVQGPFGGWTQYSSFTCCTKTDLPINAYEEGRKKERKRLITALYPDWTRDTVPKVTNLLEWGLEYKIKYEAMDAANSFHNPHAGVPFFSI